MLNFHFFLCTAVMANETPELPERFGLWNGFPYDLPKCFKFVIEVTTSHNFLEKNLKMIFFPFKFLFFQKAHVFLHREHDIHYFCIK